MSKHIVSPVVYIVIFVSLMLGTAITIWAAFQNFGKFNIVIALAIATIKATPRQTGVEEIRIPGERGYRTRARLMREGIEIDAKIHNALGRLAEGRLDHGG